MQLFLCIFLKVVITRNYANNYKQSILFSILNSQFSTIVAL